MALTAGSRLGVYEIVAPIGAGGMGQVFRARDTKLDRHVAIKILPDAFAHDADRVARFTREAKTLASLNHPHIAGIYGLETGLAGQAGQAGQAGPAKTSDPHAEPASPGSPAPPVWPAQPAFNFIVMEFVDGEDLSNRIARGALPLDEALPIAKQIADALDAAHAQGIIHRDLKPANIKVRTDGTVKVLDFGLAKAIDGAGTAGGAGGTGGAGRAGDVSLSPTITSPAMTHAGMILGTAAYMSPEQARGKAVDKRADIWAFGVVFFEMLTGQRLFAGEEVSDTLAFVLTKEPDWSSLPAATPPPIARLLRRCLTRDRAKRLADIADARIEIDEALTAPAAGAAAVVAPSASRASTWTRMLPWAIAGALAIALGVVTWRRTSEPPPISRRMQLTVPSLPETPTLFQAISPDARVVVLRYAEGLMVRSLETGEARTLAGTQGARGPFWSPDSRYIGFTSFNDRALRIVPAAGGAPQTICSNVDAYSSGTWGKRGTILFSSSGRLMRVSASGGPCTELTPATDQPRVVETPMFLPDGDHFVYVGEHQRGQHAMFVASLNDPVGRELLREESSAVFAPESIGSPKGWLLFLRPLERLLMAQAFDSRSMEVSGDPIIVAKDVGATGNGAQPDVSVADDGTILYQVNGQAERQLVWYDRTGVERGRGPRTGAFGGWMAFSPDVRRVAFHRSDPTDPDAPGFMIADVNRARESRIALPTDARAVVWAPDNERIAFGGSGSTPGSAAVIISSAAGAAPRAIAQIDTRAAIDVSDWSRDGTSIVYTVVTPDTGADIWMLRLPAAEGATTPAALLQSSANESEGQLSPDGRWLAYFSDEAGQGQIYLRRIEVGGRLSATKWQVSNATRAINPRWRADSKELFYLDLPGAARQGKVMAVPIGSEPEPVGTPTALFDIRMSSAPPQENRFMYAPTPDGQRFLVNVFASRVQSSLEIIFNWARK